MKIPLRWRVLWYNKAEDYYQEMYLTREQFECLDATEIVKCDVTGMTEHEEKFKRIKMAIKEKLK